MHSKCKILCTLFICLAKEAAPIVLPHDAMGHFFTPLFDFPFTSYDSIRKLKKIKSVKFHGIIFYTTWCRWKKPNLIRYLSRGSEKLCMFHTRVPIAKLDKLLLKNSRILNYRRPKYYGVYIAFPLKQFMPLLLLLTAT